MTDPDEFLTYLTTFGPAAKPTKHLTLVFNPTRPHIADRLTLPLPAVLTRLVEAIGAGHTTFALTGRSRHHTDRYLHQRDSYWVLPACGVPGRRLLLLLTEARARRFDTVRLSTGPYGPVVGVSRRRYRPHTAA